MSSLSSKATNLLKKIVALFWVLWGPAMPPLGRPSGRVVAEHPRGARPRREGRCGTQGRGSAQHVLLQSTVCVCVCVSGVGFCVPSPVPSGVVRTAFVPRNCCRMLSLAPKVLQDFPSLALSDVATRVCQEFPLLGFKRRTPSAMLLVKHKFRDDIPGSPLK